MSHPDNLKPEPSAIVASSYPITRSMGWRSSRLETDADIDSTYTVDLVFPLVPALIDPWQGVAVVDVFEDTGMVVVRMAMRDATLSDRAAVSGFTSSVLAPLPEGASR